MKRHPLVGATLCLTSKHGKLKAVAAPFRRSFEAFVFETCDIDTDQLGTFTGEVERKGTPTEVAIEKAKLGAQAHGCRYGVATEGAFGPDPELPLVPSHREVMAWVDLAQELSIVETFITRRTNFSALDGAGDESSLAGFLKHAKFPSHGLIVSAVDPVSTDKTSSRFIKGIRDSTLLKNSLVACKRRSLFGTVRIETDMRAHLNPTRQAVIRRLSRKMAFRLKSCCARCHYPGWGIAGSERGLECEECRLPTRLIRSLIYGCANCGYQENHGRPDGVTYASPRYCENCNP